MQARLDEEPTPAERTAAQLERAARRREKKALKKAAVGEKLEKLYGAVVAQTYAMTESMPIAANP